MIADTVFLPIGIVGVAGTERVDEIAVVPAAGVLVSDQQGDRGAGRLPFEDARENLDRVAFLPLCHMAGCARLAAVEIFLNVLGGKRQPRRTAVNDAADRGAVTFPE
jgi:hypothetical protein